MHARDIILHNQHRIIIEKAHLKFQLDLLKIFRERLKKVKKQIMHNLHLIMHAVDTTFID